MNIHWDATKRRGLYGSANVGIKQYRTGEGRRINKNGEWVRTHVGYGYKNGAKPGKVA